MRIERLTGTNIEPRLESLAQLRITVFREFPYLYDGSLDNERRYIREFAASPRSTLVVACDGDRVVGAATACPLLEHGEADVGSAALQRVGIAPERVYYFGESVLLKPYRGQRIGHAFFDQREAAAREHGFAIASFCAVVRPDDHPARPSDYVPHDAFWTKRGYTRHAAAVATYTWRDLQGEETAKPMVFWTKELA